MEFSPDTRQKNIDRMKQEVFDLVIIGGGITGAAAARDAALRGLSTALLERGDFASGTSSKSARMIHGGFRYLEQFQFGLVMSACAERFTLLQSAPSLVRPAKFVFPVFGNAKNSLLMINLGMWLYDLIARCKSLERHKVLRPKEVIEREPAVRMDGLTGAICYYDCLTDDARFTLEVVKSANALGAAPANYVEATGVLKENGRVSGVEARDVITGETFMVRCRAAANAAGVWVDQIRSLDDPKAELRLRANRGSHIVLPRERVPLNDVVIFTSVDGKRGMYAVPWEDTVIVGTTDLDHLGDLDEVYATAEEVEWMLEAVNYAFTGAKLAPKDVIATYAGLRPLTDGKVLNAYQASRDHEIYESESGLLSIAGGKFTTHRKMAEDLVDRVVKKIRGMEGAGEFQPCRTGNTSIGNPEFDRKAWVVRAQARYPLLERRILERLSNTYGAGAESVLEYAEQGGQLSKCISPDLPYLFAEIPYAVRFEMAMTLADFMVRRTHILYEARDNGLAAAEPAARLMGSYLGWDAGEIRRNVEQYREEIAKARRFLLQGQKIQVQERVKQEPAR